MTNDKQRERLVELIIKGNNQPCGNGYPWEDNYCKGCEYEGKKDCRVLQLADYLLANGVFVPPCKVGDKVYYFSKNPINLSVMANTIYEADVVRIVTIRIGTTLVLQIHNEYGCTEIPDVNDWGITVFPTKEEAEEALGGVQR